MLDLNLDALLVCRKEPEITADNLYRYEGYEEVYLVPFKIQKRTKKGCWIHWYGSKLKFVLNDGRKRFAVETREAALANFIVRKNKQLKILQSQVQNTLYALENAAKLKDKK